MRDCLFCKIVRQEIPAKVIDENDSVIVFLSLQNHPLIVPKKHIETIFEMDDEIGSEVIKEAIKIAKAVKTGLHADGVNLLQNNGPAANQEVMHFHLHIKPRFMNDQVKIHFPPKDASEEEKDQIVKDLQSALQ